MPQQRSTGTSTAEEPFAAEVTQTRPGVVTVLVAGEVDLTTRPRLDHVVRDVLAARPWRLTLDLTAVTFCGSAGLNALVGLCRAAADSGVRVQLRPSERIHRLLAITGLAGELPLAAASA